jgi:hypothetical protein
MGFALDRARVEPSNPAFSKGRYRIEFIVIASLALKGVRIGYESNDGRWLFLKRGRRGQDYLVQAGSIGQRKRPEETDMASRASRKNI